MKSLREPCASNSGPPVDYDEVFRVGLRHYFETSKRTHAGVAAALRIPPAEFEAFLAGERSASVAWISRACALWRQPIGEFFEGLERRRAGQDATVALLSESVFRRLARNWPVEFGRVLEVLGPTLLEEPGLGHGLLSGLRYSVTAAEAADFATPHLLYALAECERAFLELETEIYRSRQT